MTTTVEKTITVDAPLTIVYNQWTQFEEFPQFMGGVKEVHQLSDTRIHWVAEIAGVRREWDADILAQVPDEKIAWAATEGATNAGSVHFSSTGAGQTLVRLSLEYEPEGLVEKAGDQLNIVERQATSDLEKFKVFIEARGSETGAWAGSVNDGAGIDNPGVEAAEASRGDSGHAGVSVKAVATGAAAAAAVLAAGALAGKSGDDSEDEVEEVEATSNGVDLVEADVIVIETDTPPSALDSEGLTTVDTDAISAGSYVEPIEATPASPNVDEKSPGT